MTDDLTDIELAARAVDTEFDWWSCGDAGPQHMDPADTAFIALANPARLLALVTELRGLRAREWRLKLSLRGVVAPCRQCGDALAKCVEQQCCVGCNHSRKGQL